MLAYMNVVHLVPAKLWNFLEARMLYNKCIENELWSYHCHSSYDEAPIRY